MRARILRELTKDELASRLADTRKELFNIRFQSATGALENTTRLRLARREIARILTVQEEAAQEEAAQEEAAQAEAAKHGLRQRQESDAKVGS